MLKSVQQKICSFEITPDDKEIAFRECKNKPVEALTASAISFMLKSGNIDNEMQDAFLKSGKVSAWCSPDFIDFVIEKKDPKLLSLLLSNVTDLRELEVLRVNLLVLKELPANLDLVMQALSYPFRTSQMISQLKSMTTPDIMSFLESIIKLADLEDISRLDILFSWTSHLIDAHYALLVMQPVFYPLLQKLHQLLEMHLEIDNCQEETFGLLQSISNANPTIYENAISGLGQSLEYYIEKSVEL